MQKIWGVLGQLAIIGLLTFFTQTGGVIYLICLPLFGWFNRVKKPRIQRFFYKTASFSILYLLINLFLVPPLSKWESGRVPLPIFGNHSLKPHQVFYFALLNHHYVRPSVKAACEKVALKLDKQFPGTKLFYLDANFPFFDGYPLHPHFTHRNGTTVDIALHWLDANNQALDGAPVSLAYGVSAMPLPGEVDMEAGCNNKYRSIEARIMSHFCTPEKYKLDEARTKELVRLFAEEKSVRKILMEPHLKTRLGLENYDKIRFQGCRAARHDDHIHVIW